MNHPLTVPSYIHEYTEGMSSSENTSPIGRMKISLITHTQRLNWSVNQLKKVGAACTYCVLANISWAEALSIRRAQAISTSFIFINIYIAREITWGFIA